MEKLTVQSTDSADEEDQISGLPAEVLHLIIRRLEHPGKAGQTIALSRQWRKVWHSYPVVEFYPYQFESNKHFQQFSDSTIERYSRDKLLGMESLKLKPCGYEKGVFVRSPSPVVLPLLDLALERKAEDVQIICAYSIDLPYRVLFNSTVKSLRLAVVAFPIDKYFLDTPLSPTSLRFLCLSVVEFEDRELLTCLIENSPLLETLKLFRYVGNMTKLRVSKASNLKELEIEDCVSVEEIGIVAPQLQSLSLRNIGFVLDFKIELATPLLNFLEISWDRMTERDIEAMISKLPSLKYLTVNNYSQLKMKLKISGSSLVEFKLYNPRELEEIELDAGPGLEKFFIKCRNSLIHELKKCEISNAGASFRSEIWYTFDPDINGWLVGFKRLMRSSNFHTIFINQRHRSGWQVRISY
ncbi:F-box/FBD/LRR-repeat protein At1g51370 [Linum grandiflorum]